MGDSRRRRFLAGSVSGEGTGDGTVDELALSSLFSRDLFFFKETKNMRRTLFRNTTQQNDDDDDKTAVAYFCQQFEWNGGVVRCGDRNGNLEWSRTVSRNSK